MNEDRYFFGLGLQHVFCVIVWHARWWWWWLGRLEEYVRLITLFGIGHFMEPELEMLIMRPEFGFKNTLTNAMPKTKVWHLSLTLTAACFLWFWLGVWNISSTSPWDIKSFLVDGHTNGSKIRWTNWAMWNTTCGCFLRDCFIQFCEPAGRYDGNLRFDQCVTRWKLRP